MSADFNGDGRRDHALYLRTARGAGGDRTAAEYTVRFVVFLGDGGDGRVLRLRHPGILELYCGQAASTYYWEPRSRTFEYVVTGD